MVPVLKRKPGAVFCKQFRAWPNESRSRCDAARGRGTSPSAGRVPVTAADDKGRVPSGKESAACASRIRALAPRGPVAPDYGSRHVCPGNNDLEDPSGQGRRAALSRNSCWFRESGTCRELVLKSFAVSVLSFWLAVAAPSCVLAGVAADLAAIETRQKRCIDKDPSNTGMKMCTYAAYGEADKVLNSVYKSAVAGLKGGATGQSAGSDEKEKLKRLVKAEQAWIVYRDAECELQGVEMLGGTGEGLVVDGCLYELTTQRAKSLSELFEPR